MTRPILLLLTIVLIVTSGCTTDSANLAKNTDTDFLHIKVDFAAPSAKENPNPIPQTTKPGWWHWVIPDWDFYRSDMVWENGAQNYPKNSNGIAGTGIHAAITCHYEGIMTIYVAGMRRYLAGGIQPHNEPIYEPICNSWVAGSDFPYSPSSDIILSLYDLPAGKYRLLSYHNNFNGRRIGDEPTGVEYAQTNQPEPPMKSIKVYPIKTIVKDYFKPIEDALVKGKTYGTPDDKIVIHQKIGTGNVTQTLTAENIPVQQVKTDAELKPSIVEFTTDGSPLAVVYTGGCCKGDDLRKHRKGGYPILNAFEIIQLK